MVENLNMMSQQLDRSHPQHRWSNNYIEAELKYKQGSRVREQLSYATASRWFELRWQNYKYNAAQ